MSMYVTICTPTFNRAELLDKLYISLKKQKFINFEWLIIDDGSLDNTEYVVSSFIEEKLINIRYIKKKMEANILL